MRIEWATICRFAEDTPMGCNILGAGMEIAVMPRLPQPVACGLVVRVGDFNDSHLIEVLDLSAANPSGVTVYSAQAQVTAEIREGAVVPEGFKAGRLLVMPLQFVANEHGIYIVTAKSGDGSSYTVNFAIVERA